MTKQIALLLCISCLHFERHNTQQDIFPYLRINDLMIFHSKMPVGHEATCDWRRKAFVLDDWQSPNPATDVSIHRRKTPRRANHWSNFLKKKKWVVSPTTATFCYFYFYIFSEVCRETKPRKHLETPQVGFREWNGRKSHWTWPGSAQKPPRPSPELSPEPDLALHQTRPEPSPEPSPRTLSATLLNLTWLCTKASISGTLLNLTWLRTKASQTFSGTFSATRLNLTWLCTKASVSGTLLNLTWLCRKASRNLLRNLLRNPVEPDLALHQSLLDYLRALLLTWPPKPLNLTRPSPEPSPEPCPRPCWTWPGSAPKPPSPEPCWTWPGSAPKPARPSPELSPEPSPQPSAEPCWTWPGSAPKPPSPEPCWTWPGSAEGTFFLTWPPRPLNLTWLCAKSSQTFNRTFSGTLLNLTWLYTKASDLHRNLTWLCTKSSQTFSKTFRDREPSSEPCWARPGSAPKPPNLLRKLLRNPVELDLALHQRLPDLLRNLLCNLVEPGSAPKPPRTFGTFSAPKPPRPSPEPSLQPCWTEPGSAPKPSRPFSASLEPSPQTCWMWPGSAPKRPRPSPEPSEPSPEPGWTWPGACTSAHRRYSGLKTPLAYAVGET